VTVASPPAKNESASNNSVPATKPVPARSSARPPDDEDLFHGGGTFQVENFKLIKGAVFRD
jgi:hypothetical protein